MKRKANKKQDSKILNQADGINMIHFAKDRQNTIFKCILLVFGAVCTVIFGIANIVTTGSSFNTAYTFIMIGGTICTVFAVLSLVYNKNAHIRFDQDTVAVTHGFNRKAVIGYSYIRTVDCEDNRLIIKTNERDYRLGPFESSAEVATILRHRVLSLKTRRPESARVLVGSIRSGSQLKLNIAKKFYHVPAYQIPDEMLPIKYVAIYESSLTGHGGVSWYAKVTSAAKVKRKFIPCPMTRNNPEEYYYIFKTEDWQKLPQTVKYIEESVYEAKFTNEDALFNSKTTYELIGLKNSEETEIYRNIRYLFSADDESDKKQKNRIKTSNCTLELQNEEIAVFRPDGCKVCGIFKCEFEKSPKKQLGIVFNALYQNKY